VDSLRLEVAPAESGSGDTFELKIFINGADVLPDASLGMDPFNVIIPTNHLLATEQPHTTRIGRCICGDYGCHPTDVTITHDGLLVHWDWLKHKPMNRRLTFDAAQYTTEVKRVACDFSWETPERTAGRLVLANADRSALRCYGIALWAAYNDWRDEGIFLTRLQIDDAFGVTLELPWAGRTPDELARQMCALLSQRPQDWTAAWHPSRQGANATPAIAGPRWTRRNP
jgi:hypothetical protein